MSKYRFFPSFLHSILCISVILYTCFCLLKESLVLNGIFLGVIWMIKSFKRSLKKKHNILSYATALFSIFTLFHMYSRSCTISLVDFAHKTYKIGRKEKWYKKENQENRRRFIIIDFPLRAKMCKKFYWKFFHFSSLWMLSAEFFR